jgi:hypothetical protein
LATWVELNQRGRGEVRTGCIASQAMVGTGTRLASCLLSAGAWCRQQHETAVAASPVNAVASPAPRSLALALNGSSRETVLDATGMDVDRILPASPGHGMD